jgi:hypothetical protein
MEGCAKFVAYAEWSENPLVIHVEGLHSCNMLGHPNSLCPAPYFPLCTFPCTSQLVELFLQVTFWSFSLSRHLPAVTCAPPGHNGKLEGGPGHN